MDYCLLCDQKAILTRQDNSSRTIYNCAHCGLFVVSDLAAEAVAAHKGEVRAFLTRRNLIGATDTVLISFDKAKRDKSYLQLTVDQIAALSPQTFSEQMEIALSNLAHLSPYPGAEIRIEMLTSSPLFYLRHNNVEALTFIIKAMMKQGYIDVKNFGASFFPCSVIISPQGWDVIAALEKRDSAGIRAKLLLVYHAGSDVAEAVGNTAENAAKECKMTFFSSALIYSENIIGNEFVAQIKAGEIIMIDLTGSQPECYYALGFAHALKKQILLTCHEKDRKKLRVDPARSGVTFWSDEKQLFLEITNCIQAAL